MEMFSIFRDPGTVSEGLRESQTSREKLAKRRLKPSLVYNFFLIVNFSHFVSLWLLGSE